MGDTDLPVETFRTCASAGAGARVAHRLAHPDYCHRGLDRCVYCHRLVAFRTRRILIRRLIMKIITQSPVTQVKPQTAKPKSRVFAWFTRIALWLIVGIVILIAIGAVYQAVATAMDK